MRRRPPGARRGRCAAALGLLVWLAAGSADAQDGAQDGAQDDGAAGRSPALAAPESADDARVVALNERGSALYAAGDYRRAVELFLQAYAVDGDPNLLFNIAACYEGLGDRDAALEKYRAFLAAPSAAPEGRPRAEAAILRLLDSESEAQRPPEPLAPALAPAPPPAAATPSPATTPALVVPRNERTPEWLPWVVVGGGATLGVTGVVIYMLGVADHREVTGASGFDEPGAVVQTRRARAEDLVASGDTKKVIGASTAAAGAAVLAGYALWRVLERSDEPAEQPALDVALSPSAASLSWSGRF